MSKDVMNIAEAQIAFENWCDTGFVDPELEDRVYRKMREDFTIKFNNIEASISSNNRSDYIKDVKFGLFLFYYFKENNFSMRYMENDNFWRFLSIKVVPNLVRKRWGVIEDHFYSRSVRIWLKAIWWYVFLSWQNNEIETEALLLSPNLNTDTIQNLVERSGRNGVYVDVYRYIMKYYTSISLEELQNLNKKIRQHSSADTFFRNIMRLNTARIMVTEPGLYEGGEKAYVLSLFKELGVSFNEA